MQFIVYMYEDSVKNNVSGITMIIFCPMDSGIDCVLHFYALTNAYAQSTCYCYACALGVPLVFAPCVINCVDCMYQ